MGYPFSGTVPNLNFAVNQLNRNQGILQKLVSVINGIVDDLTHGAGGTASNEKVEAAVNGASTKHLTTTSPIAKLTET